MNVFRLYLLNHVNLKLYLFFIYSKFFNYLGDIIIERWIPYGPQAKRRTIIQRAPPAVQYSPPRNIIVVYEKVQARVVRQFQRLGVTQENPEAYLARFGDSLLDAATLVQQARAAGVIEDIVIYLQRNQSFFSI